MVSVPGEPTTDYLNSPEFLKDATAHFTRAKQAAIAELERKGIEPAGPGDAR